MHVITLNINNYLECKIITLNVNGLNALVKSIDWLSRWKHMHICTSTLYVITLYVKLIMFPLWLAIVIFFYFFFWLLIAKTDNIFYYCDYVTTTHLIHCIIIGQQCSWRWGDSPGSQVGHSQRPHPHPRAWSAWNIISGAQAGNHNLVSEGLSIKIRLEMSGQRYVWRDVTMEYLSGRARNCQQ